MNGNGCYCLEVFKDMRKRILKHTKKGNLNSKYYTISHDNKFEFL